MMCVMPLDMEVGLCAGDFVLDEDPALPALKGHSPQFSANVCCAQRLDGLICLLVWR